jgi:hypothetical protein
MDIAVKNKIIIQDALGEFMPTVKARLTFPNPKWIENDKRGYWNGKTPKQLKGFEQSQGGLLIPRGFIWHLLRMAKAQNERISTSSVKHKDLTFPVLSLCCKAINQNNEVLS